MAASCWVLSRREPVPPKTRVPSLRVGGSPKPPKAVFAQPFLAQNNRRGGSVSPSLHVLDLGLSPPVRGVLVLRPSLSGRDGRWSCLLGDDASRPSKIDRVEERVAVVEHVGHAHARPLEAESSRRARRSAPGLRMTSCESTATISPPAHGQRGEPCSRRSASTPSTRGSRIPDWDLESRDSEGAR